jgi:hypothetical protein
VARKFLPDVKYIFDKPHEENKRRYMYVIYKRIDANYYGDGDDENGILEKFQWTTEEEMWARALREWQRIKSI